MRLIGPELHRLAGYAPAAGRHLPAAARTLARRRGVYLAFRGDLRGGDQLARGHGFGLSRLVSLGNQADVNETDILTPVAADPFTRVLTLYLEGIRDGGRFTAEAGPHHPHRNRSSP